MILSMGRVGLVRYMMDKVEMLITLCWIRYREPAVNCLFQYRDHQEQRNLAPPPWWTWLLCYARYSSPGDSSTPWSPPRPYKPRFWYSWLCGGLGDYSVSRDCVVLPTLYLSCGLFALTARLTRIIWLSPWHSCWNCSPLNKPVIHRAGCVGLVYDQGEGGRGSTNLLTSKMMAMYRTSQMVMLEYSVPLRLELPSLFLHSALFSHYAGNGGWVQQSWHQSGCQHD